MNREEILERSRQENSRHDEREKNTFDLAGNMSSVVGGIICCLIIIFDSIIGKKTNASIWSVYFFMTGTNTLIKARELDRKKDYPLGFLQVGLGLAYFIMHAIRLVREING